MYRSHYDNDVTTFSPQGRLHQVEYALEAVKQGAVCVGMRTKTHVVLFAIQRRLGDELAGHQKKVLKLDEHLAVAFSGLTSDARVLSNFLQTNCLRFRMLYDRALPASRASFAVANKAQSNTQGYGARPYGVGILLAAVDNTGPHLYEISPAGTATEYLAHAIGARSQSARTFLETIRENLIGTELENGAVPLSTLLSYGLRSLRSAVPSDQPIEADGVAIAVGAVGETPVQNSMHLYTRDEIAELLLQHADVLATTSTRPLLEAVEQPQQPATTEA